MRKAVLLLALLAGCGGPAPRPDELEMAARRFRVAPGLKVEPFAAEPQLVNPVAFSIDEQGRFYVVETHRIGTSVFDIRGYMSWLDDDLACRTVEERLAMYRKQMGEKAATLAVESERVRRIEDRDGDGRADHAVTFAEDFRTQADGIASGVLVRKGDVWLANIPNLWLLRDRDGDGVAEERKVLHTGYGVHMNYIGHDLHGLILGPDGKLYFSIGDRGLHVESGGKTISNPDSGAILRCNPDGSGLELYATGLRNPQELAFDQHGNLWTWDNNSDWHDMARWVYVAEGGDSGWRIGYQFLEARGPWESEKVWEAGAEVPYRLPPVANVDHGPSGIAFYPGTGLSERYDNHFLLCNFPGGVNAWAVKEKGATFELVDKSEFLWGLWATDVEFGADGAVYVSDWGEGWSKKGVGRIWRVVDPERRHDPKVHETWRLLTEGMEKRRADELEILLGHRDRRVRQEAQFELAARRATDVLARAASRSESLLARLHAVWGLGQVGADGMLAPLLRDKEAELRAQAAKALGERRVEAAHDEFVRLLKDPAPRVRYQAALALSKVARAADYGAVMEFVREGGDAWLRHAGVMALAGIRDADALARSAGDASRPARLAALLAMRRLERPEIKVFLKDKDPALVLEAARAINDVPIPGAMAELAALAADRACPEAVLPRALNACFRTEAVAALATFLNLPDSPEALRAEAMRMFREWEKPSGRDRIVGLWRPLPARNGRDARRWVAPALGGLLQAWSRDVRLEAVRLWAVDKPERERPLVRALLEDRASGSTLRIEALRALADPELAVDDPDEAVRREAVRMLRDPARLGRIAAADGLLAVRQAAIAALVETEGEDAKAEIAKLTQIRHPGLMLDLEEAIVKRSVSTGLGIPAPILEGGDPAAGSAVYWRPASGCVKCHKLKDGGGSVGPVLTAVATRLRPDQILDSILEPNREIAKGYEQVLVRTTAGDVRVGKVEREDDRELVLMDDQGSLVTLAKSSIEARKSGKSAMPEDLAKSLTRREIRDLVAYLGQWRAVDPKTLPLEPGAVVVDNEDPARFRTEGNWRTQTAGGDYGSKAHWSFPDATGRGKGTWTATLPRAGRWRVYAWTGLDPVAEHASNARFTVVYEKGEADVRVDQTKETCAWRLLGTWTFGTSARVVLSNDADKPVFADAIKFVPE